MRNRSVPTNAALPHLAYANVAEAIEWLGRVFGFREHYRYGNPTAPAGAQLVLGEAVIMLEASRPNRRTPLDMGGGTQYLTVFVEDVDDHYAHARAEGATIVEEMNETIYGERQYGAQDLAGHVWLFSQHMKDADPAEWGAVVASPN